MDDKLKIKFDFFGFIALIFTFVSILFSIRLSFETTILSVGVFLIIIATYTFIILRETINKHGKEIHRLNEKINIHKDISDLKAKVDYLFNKMGKRGNGDLVEVFIRLIQIAAIIFAGYIILKAIGAL